MVPETGFSGPAGFPCTGFTVPGKNLDDTRRLALFFYRLPGQPRSVRQLFFSNRGSAGNLHRAAGFFLDGPCLHGSFRCHPKDLCCGRFSLGSRFHRYFPFCFYLR